MRIAFSENVPVTGNHVSLEVYFDSNATTPTVFDRAVVAALGIYTYKSDVPVQPGNSAIIDVARFAKVGQSEVQVIGSEVILRYNPAETGSDQYSAVLLRFLPGSIPLSDLGSDLNSVNAIHLHYPYTRGSFTRRVMVPSGEEAPEGGPPPQADLAFAERSGSSFFCYPSDSAGTYVQSLVAQVMPDATYGIIADTTPGKDAPRPEWNGMRRMPPDWGPGGENDDQRFYVPVPVPLPSDMIQCDADGDGQSDDYILPGHDKIPYTDLMLGYYVINGQTIVTVVGKDLNGNGRLDPNEILHPVGECVYDPAQNECDLWIIDKEVWIVWKNTKLDDRGRPLPNGPATYYMFNVDKNLLFVKKYGEDGKLQKWNPGPLLDGLTIRHLTSPTRSAGAARQRTILAG